MPSYYLGVDVSKGYADFVILNEKKQPVENNFQLDDTFDGHCCLYEKLYNFFKIHPESLMCAAVESTGGYENNWFNSLIKFQGNLNLKTARLNPLGVNANSKADLKRIITDKISAQNVAEYLIAHPEKVIYQEQNPIIGLKKQWGFIRMLTKQRTQLLNQLESLIYVANPELVIYCKGETPMWFLKLLENYPTASELSKGDVKVISKIPYIIFDRAQEIVDKAKKSIASATDKNTAQLIKATVSQIIHLNQTIKSQTGFMANECRIPEVDLLKSFPGIGDFSAIGLMIEIQSIERFSSVKKLSAFFGIHPAYKTSGDGSSCVKMRGQPE